MNIRLISSIVAALGLCATIIVGVLLITNKDSEVEAIITSGSVEVTSDKDIEVERDIEVEIMNLEALSSVIGAGKLPEVLVKVESLYGAHLPELVEVNTDIDRYYEFESDTILHNFGKEDLQSFKRLYNKVIKVPDYKKCVLEINAASLASDEKYVYFELIATYDEALTMDYYVTLNLSNLAITLE